MPSHEEQDKRGDSFSPYSLLRKLDSLTFKVDTLQTSHDKMSSEVNKFSFIVHEIKIVKKIAWAILAAFIVIAAGAISSEFHLRIGGAPTPSSSSERLGPDRVPKPEVP